MAASGFIRELIDRQAIFDTHEHAAGFDWGFTGAEAAQGSAHPHKPLPHVLMNDMLCYQAGAAGCDSAALAPERWPLSEAPAYWRSG